MLVHDTNQKFGITGAEQTKGNLRSLERAAGDLAMLP